MMEKYFFSMMDDCPKHWLILVLLLTFNPSYGQSCDSSACHCERRDLNPSGIMIGHSHPKGVWLLSYRYMNMRMKGELSGTEKINDGVIFQNYIMSPNSMNMGMHMIMAMYGITNKLSVMAMFNYMVQSMNMNMLPGSMQMQMNGMMMSNKDATTMTTKTAGFGDSKVYAVYSAIDKDKFQLALSAGLNLPTGSTGLKGDALSMLPGQRLPYMMQLGSGTFDFLPGVTGIFNKGKFTLGTQLLATYRAGYNSLGYALGNELTLNSWVGFRCLPWLGFSARAEGFASGKINGRDPGLYEIMEPDSKAANYGGQRASAFFGMNIYLKNFAGSRCSFEYGQPFYQTVNGTQLAAKNMFYAGWSISF